MKWRVGDLVKARATGVTGAVKAVKKEWAGDTRERVVLWVKWEGPTLQPDRTYPWMVTRLSIVEALGEVLE